MTALMLIQHLLVHGQSTERQLLVSTPLFLKLWPEHQDKLLVSTLLSPELLSWKMLFSFLYLRQTLAMHF